MGRYSLIALLSASLLAPGLAGAQDLDKGKNAALRGDYGAALAEFRPLAEQGNAEAQYGLANLYREGRGVPRDDDQAAAWYRRAAAGGSWWAAFDLGMLYWGQHQASRVGAGGTNKPPNDALVRVHMWLGIAAATGDVGCVAVAAPLRDAVAQSMTTGQIGRAEELTRAWLAEHETTGVNIASTGKSGC